MIHSPFGDTWRWTQKWRFVIFVTQAFPTRLVHSIHDNIQRENAIDDGPSNQHKPSSHPTKTKSTERRTLTFFRPNIRTRSALLLGMKKSETLNESFTHPTLRKGRRWNRSKQLTGFKSNDERRLHKKKSDWKRLCNKNNETPLLRSSPSAAKRTVDHCD